MAQQVCLTCGFTYDDAALTHRVPEDCLTVLIARAAALEAARQQVTVNLDRGTGVGAPPRLGKVKIVS